MDMLREKYSNAEGTFLKGVTLNHGDEIMVNVGGKARKFRVTMLSSWTGLSDKYYKHSFTLQTCDGKKFKQIQIHGS